MRLWILGLVVVATSVVSSGCKQKSQLVVGVITNLKVQGELSDVQMDLSRNDVLFQSYTWNISDQKALDFVLPGSFTLYSDGGGEPVTNIVVTGFHGDAVKVTRTATIQLQSEQDVFYRMGLVFACSTGQPNATCPDNFNCVEGICKPIVIDAKTLKPWESSRASTIECDSGTAYIDSSTCSSGACATIPPKGSCADTEFCQEGTCYARNPDVPRSLEFGEACNPSQNDGCRESGFRCEATTGSDARCRQSCSVDADCSRRLPDAIAQSIGASNARCIMPAGQSSRVCTYACDPLSVADGGCLSGTICTLIDSNDTADPLASECVSVRSDLAIVPLGGACTSQVGQCGAGAVCLTGTSGMHCQKLCAIGGPTACATGSACLNLRDTQGHQSAAFGACCPSTGCL